MRIARLYWKDHLREKIEVEHGVLANEVEEMFKSTYKIRKSGKNRYLVWGQTRGGRCLFVVLDDEGDVQVPVSAREMTPKEKQYYKRHKK